MSKRLAVVLIDRFADWEHGFLTAATRDFFSGTVRFFTPDAGEVVSEGGMRPRADGAIAGLRPADFDALAVIGSGAWSTDRAPDLGDLLRSAEQAGKIIGCICKGTLAGARAGLLNDRPHTSNDRKTLEEVSAYRGQAHYQDVPRAVRAGKLITAPGIAPRSFAYEMASALFPENTRELGWMLEELSAESFG